MILRQDGIFENTVEVGLAELKVGANIEREIFDEYVLNMTVYQYVIV